MGGALAVEDGPLELAVPKLARGPYAAMARANRRVRGVSSRVELAGRGGRRRGGGRLVRRGRTHRTRGRLRPVARRSPLAVQIR